MTFDNETAAPLFKGQLFTGVSCIFVGNIFFYSVVGINPNDDMWQENAACLLFYAFVGKSHYWTENQQGVKTLAATKGSKSMRE